MEADADRVRQTFENLFRNAVEHDSTSARSHAREHSEERDPSDITVTVAAAPTGFTVGDDGPEIPVAERERVFSSGYTTSENGTEFGLAIVQRIADAHSWNVALEESEEGGARFAFTVPDTD